MSITAFGEFVTELGDTAQAVIEALARHPILKRTVTKTDIEPGGKRKHEIRTTKTNEWQFSAFHVVFFLMVTGIWTPFRDLGGDLKIAWWEIFKGEFGKWPDLFDDLADRLVEFFPDIDAEHFVTWLEDYEEKSAKGWYWKEGKWWKEEEKIQPP